MRNSYEVRGNHAVIFMRRQTGAVLETTVDLEGLHKAQSWPGTWCPLWKEDQRSWRVRGSDGDRKRIYLHRFLTDCPPGQEVDHVNHDTLDNRSTNLRVVDGSANKLNRRGATRLSHSGIRGVQMERSGRWRARLKLDGRTVSLGTYVEQADAAAAVTRKLRELGVPQ